MNDYIVASCKEWHLEGFAKNTESLPGRWTYVDTPERLEDKIERTTPKYIFFLHWNWIVEESIWSKHECVCFHMTDLPYGRGGSPLQNLIQDGKKETKLTALQMVKELDAGPIYAKTPMTLEGRAEEIYMRAGEKSWELIKWLVEDEPTPSPQQGTVVTFKRRNPSQSNLPASLSLDRIYDHIRMLDAPTYPPAFIEHEGIRIEFSHAALNKDNISAKVTIRKICT